MSDPYRTLYDFESAIEAAVKTVLEEYDLEVYAANDHAELQKSRPRVEIEFTTGAATDHRSTQDDVYRPDAYTGTLTLRCVCSSARPSEEEPAQGTELLSTYRANIRRIMGEIETTLTTRSDELLPFHDVNRLIEAGTSSTYAPEDGVVASDLSFEVHFNIQPDAWPVSPGT